MSSRKSIFGKSQIIVGDKTSHGGMVTSGSLNNTWHGVAIARKGDQVFCPACPPHRFVIAEGVENYTDAMLPIATEGHTTTCGAILMAEPASPAAMRAAHNFLNGSGFDEALQFVSKNGTPLAGVRYTLHVADGTIHHGETDEHGKTARIVTEKAAQLSKVILEPEWRNCCSAMVGAQSQPIEIPLTGSQTSNFELGESFVTQEVPVHERPLTAGEIRMAKLIFNDAVDYKKVKAHNHPWLHINVGSVAQTPSGEMHFPDVLYKVDYSREIDLLKILFIHEMVHIWQYQLGYGVKLKGGWIGLKGGYGTGSPAYQYDATAGASTTQKIQDFNMEQQGDIISHYFSVEFLKFAKYTDNSPFYKMVLRDFLRDPRNANLLPTNTDF